MLMPMSTNEHVDPTGALPGEIRAERARQHLTQSEVFERAGISKSAYLKIENGQRGANMAQLAAIADALGLPLSELVVRAENAVRASGDRIPPGLGKRVTEAERKDLAEAIERTSPTKPASKPVARKRTGS